MKAYFWFFQAYFWRFQAYSCLCKTCSCLFQTGSAARKNPLSFPRLASPLALLLTPLARAAGPYPGGPGSPDTDAIPAASVLYRGWATGVSAFAPGPRQAGTNATPVNYGSAPSVLGPPDAAGATYPVVGPNPIPAAPVLSLGDGGSVTLTFSPPIADGEGPDFAVFENGFATTATGLFAELAFVEVSSNGQDFTRFPAISCTQTLTQLTNGGTLDPRDLHNLAGKHPAGYGTPFDLSELTASPALDTSRITHIRITDVTGDVKNGRGSRDSLGQLINDPWPTNFQTSGFDLDAIGVMHQTPAVPALTLTVAAHSVALQYLRDPLDTTSTLTLQHSLNGTDWQPLAESIKGQDTQPLRNDVTITEGLPGPPIPVIVTAARTAPREFYRLRLATTP